MRLARDNGLLKSDDGKIIGINLGADYVSEHEWGIKKLRQKFGIQDSGYGLEKRTVQDIPKYVDFIDKGKQTVLIVGGYKPGDAIDLKRYELDRREFHGDGLITAWDEGSFGINASKAEDREAVRQIHNAMMEGDLAIWVGGGGVFQNAGLVLAIVHRVPEELSKKLYDADVDREKLKKAAEETGIAERLKVAGRQYYALSPEWVVSEETNTSKYNLIFWLNPADQQNNACGWFRVEDLDLWIEGKGPIIERSNSYKKKQG